MNGKIIITLLLSSLFLTGCATSRDILKMDTSDMKAIEGTPNGKTVYINTVTDNRVFEAKPKEPSTPSLDLSESDNSDIRSRAIARKRNGFGKALGDILLEPNVTIPNLITLSLEKSLRERGYSVISKKEEIDSETYIVDVKVNKFWSWMNPGAFAITISTEISTDLTMKNQNVTVLDDKNIYVKESDNFQTGMQENWIAVIKKAVHSFSSEVSKNI